MKGGTVQITWHGSDPVLTLDFHGLSGLLATGGADHDIKLWTLHKAKDGPLPSPTFHSSLSYHTAAVNVVRFSFAGDQLASGADGGEIFLWKLTDNLEASNMWKLAKNLRFHVKDVLDLQWSSDGGSLISGSVDNTVIIWDIAKGNPQQVLKDHMHYVQGVAWDPLGQYIASISGDRTCRIYCNKSQNAKSKSQDRQTFSCRSVLVKPELPKQDDDSTKGPSTKSYLFHDETLPSFFRRLSWSPEGSFLLLPAGIHKFPSENVSTNTAFIVSRKDLSRPAVQLPGASKPVVAVRFCPVLYSQYSHIEQNPNKDINDAAIFKLPYRLVFAVATLNSLYVYDTQSPHPLAILAGIHYAAITDIAWSHDGQFLAVSSQDGFCTLVMFDEEELGSPLALSDVPSFIVGSICPSTDEVGVSKTKLSKHTMTANIKGISNGMPVKKVGMQSNSASTIDKPLLDQEDKAQVSKVPRNDCKTSAACPKSQKELSNGMSHAELPVVGNEAEPANRSEAMFVEGHETENVPVMLKKMSPIIISSPSQPNEGAPCVSNLDVPTQLCQGGRLTSEHGPKKPRKITPVAIPSEALQDNHALNNVGLLSPNQANLSSMPGTRASPKPVQLPKDSNNKCTAFPSSASEKGPEKKDLPSSPKRPRRITPVAIPSEALDNRALNKVRSLSQQHANLSSMPVIQASPRLVQLPKDPDDGCLPVPSSNGEEVLEKDLPSSPKRPRRITPEPVLNCNESQTKESSRDDMKD